MNKGCFYVWKAWCNPYAITPEEKISTLGVIRDIPYLRRDSDLCQPSGATDEDFRLDALPSRKETAADDNVDAAQPGDDESVNPPCAHDESEERTSGRNLREEAMSMNHLLTNKPFNIH